MTVSFTIQDTVADRVKDAFDVEFSGRPAGTNKAQWVEKQCKLFCRRTMRDYEANKLGEEARLAAKAQAETDFGDA